MSSNTAEPLTKNVGTGNITFSISDHLPQFFFLPGFFSNNYTYRRNDEVYDWSRFNENSFSEDFNFKDWNSVMEIEKNDVNIYLNNYLSKVKSLIMSYVPMKKLNKQQKKNYPEALVYSIHKKNKIFKKYIKCQNSVTKNDLHREYKSYRNKLSTIIKESKTNYYNDYFRNKLKNIKKHMERHKINYFLKVGLSPFKKILLYLLH